MLGINAAMVHFYPRSPCGERPYPSQCRTLASDFYPRSPCGERPQSRYHGSAPANFYPRSPCGERHRQQKRQTKRLKISIHALLAESDECSLAYVPPSLIFLSTLSLRRATIKNGIIRSESGISIHALLAESDRESTSI